MKKQKICIIGGGITGLTVAFALARQKVNIDLIDQNFYVNNKTLRTTAISNSNYLFLKKFNELNFFNNLSWPCNGMKIYDIQNESKKNQILDFNSKKNESAILHIIENSKFNTYIKKEIKKNKKISVKNNFKVKKIFSSDGLKCIKTSNNKVMKYNLVILCTGKNSILTKNILEDQYFNYNYKEVSMVLNISHNICKNNIARQFFLKEGPLAFLPISNNATSVIWSIKEEILKKYKNNNKFFFKSIIENLCDDIYKNVKFSNKIEYHNLNFHIGNKCYKDRVLIFGDALYSVHPIAGQGFNMILRDLQKLIKTINKKISLGLDIGNSSILSEFDDDIVSNNFIYSMGIDTVKKIFSTNNKVLKNLRNYSALQINKNENIKSLFVNIADKGINL